jgi:hypothetical protein
MVSCVLGDKSLKLLDKIPVSNDTIARRIDDMAGDAENQQLTTIEKQLFCNSS